MGNAQLRGASKCWVFGAVPCGESVKRSASDDRCGGWLPIVATAIRESYEIVNSHVKLIRRLAGHVAQEAVEMADNGSASEPVGGKADALWQFGGYMLKVLGLSTIST